VSVAHVEVFNALAMNEAGLNKWGVLACNIDVLLRLYFSTKLTRRGIPASGWRGPLCQVMGVCHPIIYMLCSSPFMSCGGALYLG
jgi:hypothetical protein